MECGEGRGGGGYGGWIASALPRNTSLFETDFVGFKQALAFPSFCRCRKG